MANRYIFIQNSDDIWVKARLPQSPLSNKNVTYKHDAKKSKIPL